MEDVKTLLLEVAAYLIAVQGKVAIEEKGAGDLVSEADRHAQQMLKKLTTLRPAAFRGEEENWSLWKRECWVVDPLDGTKNYLAGSDKWGIFATLFDGEQPVYATIYSHADKSVYTAEKGKGAWCDGRELHVNSSLPKNIFASSKARRRFPQWHHESIAVTVGSKMLKGEIEATIYISGKGSVWDYAPIALLIEEAGGRATDLEGKPLNFFRENPLMANLILSNGVDHQVLLQQIADSLKEQPL